MRLTGVINYVFWQKHNTSKTDEGSFVADNISDRKKLKVDTDA